MIPLLHIIRNGELPKLREGSDFEVVALRDSEGHLIPEMGVLEWIASEGAD